MVTNVEWAWLLQTAGIELQQWAGPAAVGGACCCRKGVVFSMLSLSSPSFHASVADGDASTPLISSVRSEDRKEVFLAIQVDGVTRARTAPLVLRGPALSLNHAFHLELERAQLLRVVMLTPGKHQLVWAQLTILQLTSLQSRVPSFFFFCFHLCSKHTGRSDVLWTNQKQSLLFGRSLNSTTLQRFITHFSDFPVSA